MILKYEIVVMATVRKEKQTAVGWKHVRLEAIKPSRADERAAIKTSLPSPFSLTHLQMSLEYLLTSPMSQTCTLLH